MDDWDWELLHDSQETKTITDEQHHQQQQEEENESTLVKKIEEEIEEKPNFFSDDVDVDYDNSGGVFRSDYFSIDSHHNHVEDENEYESYSSDNPSWIDPSNSSITGGRDQRIRISSSNSDSSGPTSDTLQLMESHHSNCDYALNYTHENPETPFSTTFNDEINTQKKDDVEEDELDNNGGNERVIVGNEEIEANSRSNEEKKVVWWRVPLEVLKYCVLKVSPVWSLSMAAAAVMGLIIIRRRYLYKMKRKTQGLQLKVIVDDKKVSQFMSRAARLNEAFSVVKRVPVLRPSLPSPGLVPWPVMSMR